MTTVTRGRDKSDSELKYFWPIVLIYVTFQLVSDVTAGKIIQVGSAQVSVTVMYFPFTYLISDVLTEVYGYARARRALWLVMISSVIAGLLYQLVVALPSAPNFPNSEAYETVLGQVPRILVSGWIAVFAGDISNNYVMAKMKVRSQGAKLWMRTVSSTIVGQAVNTAVFYIGALSGLLPTNILLSAIFWAWLVKCLVEVVFTPLTYLVVGYLKRQEEVDVYDLHTDFSPIKY